jgi:hypothetical protein
LLCPRSVLDPTADVKVAAIPRTRAHVCGVASVAEPVPALVRAIRRSPLMRRSAKLADASNCSVLPPENAQILGGFMEAGLRTSH